MRKLYKKIAVTSFLVSLPTTFLLVFLPFFLQEKGLTTFQIGFALAFIYLVQFILSTAIGFAQAKIERIKILVGSYFGYIFLPFLYLNINGFLTALAVTTYDGIVSSMRFVSTYSLLENKKSYETGVNVSIVEAMTNLGSLLGPIMAGLIALYYGLDIVFFIASIVLSFAAAYSISLFKHVRKRKNFSSKGFVIEVKTLLKNKPFLVVILIYFFYSIIAFSRYMAITLYMDKLLYSTLAIGFVGSASFFFTFLFELFSGTIAKRKRRNRLLVLGLLLASASMLFPLTQSLAGFVLLAMLFSLGTAFIVPATFANLAKYGDRDSYTDTGMLFSMSRLGGVIGLIASGAILLQSFSLFFYSSAIIMLLASVFAAAHYRIFK